MESFFDFTITPFYYIEQTKSSGTAYTAACIFPKDRSSTALG